MASNQGSDLHYNAALKLVCCMLVGADCSITSNLAAPVFKPNNLPLIKEQALCRNHAVHSCHRGVAGRVSKHQSNPVSEKQDRGCQQCTPAHALCKRPRGNFDPPQCGKLLLQLAFLGSLSRGPVRP